MQLNHIKYILSIGISTTLIFQCFKAQAQNTIHTNLSKMSQLSSFKTDGCSMSPDSLFGKDFTHCCIAHDVDYFIGGTFQRKQYSDFRLKACIEETIGNVVIVKISNENLEWSLGEFYRKFVSLGDSPSFKEVGNSFPLKWGFGWQKKKTISFMPLIVGELVLGIKELESARDEVQTILNSPYTVKFDRGTYQGLELSGAQLFYILNIFNWKIKELNPELSHKIL